MAWFWTDDLARLLIDEDRIAPERIRHWTAAPIAHRSEDDALTVARRLLAGELAGDGVATDAA